VAGPGVHGKKLLKYQHFQLYTADWKGNKLIAPNDLARLLEPLGIGPGSIRLEDNRVLRGYQLSHFQDAFERYLPSSPLPQASISNRYNSTTPAAQALPGSLATATRRPCSALKKCG